MPYRLSIEDQIIAALRRIIRAVDLHSRRLVESYGLTGPQLATLREAARLGPVPAGGLAKAVHISHSTLTGILDRLERQGMVRRIRSGEDRRSVTAAVTDQGMAILRAEPSLLQDRFHTELARLQQWEQTLMLSTLQRIASMMDAEGIDASPVLVTGSVGPGSREDTPVPAPVDRASEAGSSTLVPGARQAAGPGASTSLETPG